MSEIDFRARAEALTDELSSFGGDLEAGIGYDYQACLRVIEAALRRVAEEATREAEARAAVCLDEDDDLRRINNLLIARDKFIVERDLWTEFVATLKDKSDG